MDLDRAQIAYSLQRLDFRVAEQADLPAGVPETAVFGLHRAGDEPVLAATAPWHRLDIAVPADLTEEVARVVGYDKVGVTLLDTALPPQRRNFVLETEEQIRDILISCGLFDTINYTLTNRENHEKMHAFNVDGQAQPPFIELENPPSVERRVMRRSLLVSAMENLAYNSRYTDRLAFFEIGRVYRPEESEGLLPKEDRRIGIGLSGPRRPTNIHADADGVDAFDFFDAKGMVETLVQRLGFRLADLRFVPRPDTSTFGPRCAQIFLNEESLGIVGEVHPRVRANFNLPEQRVCLIELHIDPLIRRGWQVEPMQPISIYQPVVEDLAFVVAEDVTVRRVQDAIKAHGGELLTDVELFDIYRGSAIPVGHKSLAFRVTYQSLTHGLGEKEVNHLRKTIIAGVEADTGGKLRG
jgi:phenylalanyl-tRNA synthetase beta chain